MAQPTLLPPGSATDAPLVRLELRHAGARPTLLDIPGEEFLIGSVPGCDLRLPGPNLPPLVCQIVRRADGVRVRKLAPTQPVLLNGQPVVTQAALAHGDCVQIGAVELHVHLALPAPAATNYRPPVAAFAPEPAHAISFVPLPPPTYAPPQPQAYSPPGPAYPSRAPDPWPQQQHDPGRFRAEINQWEEHRQRMEADLQRQRQALDERRLHLEEQTRELESDRVLWYRRREEIERECKEQTGRTSAMVHQLRERELEMLRAHAEYENGKQQLERERREVANLRQEAANLQQEFNNRLRVERQQFDAQVSEFKARVEQFTPRWQELDERERAIQEREQLLLGRGWSGTTLREAMQQLDARDADLKTREARLAAEQQAVQQLHAQYQQNLVRLDQSQTALEHREREVQGREQEVQSRYEHMHRDALDLEEQARQLDTNQEEVRLEAERLAQQKSEQEVLASSLAERAATLEGQQAMLAALRTRLERMREDIRQQAQQLATERTRQEELATQLKERLLAAEKLKTELDEEDRGRIVERSSFEERNTALQTAIVQLRQLQEKLEAEEKRLNARTEQLSAQAADQAEQTALLRARAQQMLELQQRLEADRQSIKAREAALTQAEEARKALQEQLRRRGEELTARAKSLDAQAQGFEVKDAEISRQKQHLDEERKKGAEQLDSLKGDLETRAAEIQRLNAALTQREDNLRRQVERLKEAGQTIAADRKSLFDARSKSEAEQAGLNEQMAKARKELDAYRSETIKNAEELARLMPELELRNQGAIDRLAQSREQLRGHLAELHTYARQSQEDLQELRTQIQAEADRLRQQELALARARSEHRLSVTAFRQQLIDWQGRVGELKQFFAQNESRLEMKQQAVEQAEKRVGEGSKQLAREAETLQQRQREVTERKKEVEGHLGDLRDWYRRKLRELAGGTGRDYTGEVLEMPEANGLNDPADPATASVTGSPGERDILTLTGDVEPGDRKLGELLLSLGLVEEEMLLPLWSEARRQRRSLRQVLLNSGAITLYQMALIEAGNIDALALGPYRVIDRVQARPKETLYRVFDPGRSTLALLRHLAESQMDDAARPVEFHQRFTAAADVQHPNVAATYEVQDINHRPAALQEWVSGLASPDWPALAAAPGVWFRLLGQAALGLRAAHEAGLTHGRLNANSVVLSPNGTLKLLGFGEPAWLSGSAEPDNGVVADLEALGRLACEWSMLMPRRKSAKSKPLPEKLQNVIRMLGASACIGFDGHEKPVLIPPFPQADRYESAGALLEDLEQAGADLPPNAEAWDRLVKHVGDNASEGAALRQTA
jgi:chromosome segregation ATPase